MFERPSIVIAALFAATPAWAQDGTAVPEGSHLTLFALGVLGVMIGRRASMGSKRRKRDED